MNFFRIFSLKIIKILLTVRFNSLVMLLVLATLISGHAESTDPEIEGMDSTLNSESSLRLYPDLTDKQNELSHQALREAYSGNPQKAHKTLATLQRLEVSKHLPPLSYLLSIAIDVMRFQNGDFEDEDAEKNLRQDIEEDAEQGLNLCRSFLDKESTQPTYLLIEGGIQGFLATLKIHSNPSQALSDGFQALKLLERARKKDSRIRDSYLGTGIFNCTAANAPLVVRATLKIFGRSVSMKPGLTALRMSAYKGQYTNVASQLFLIQFLSPYGDELVREKRQIFHSLETAFPQNAYYTFLKTDEELSFYPDSFYTKSNGKRLANRIMTFRTGDFSSRRYSHLVRYQYSLINSKAEKRLAPDSSFDLRDYAYYPVLIEGLRFKHQTEDTLGEGESPPTFAIKTLKAYLDSCKTIIDDSPMNPTRRRYYQWHVADALRWKVKGVIHPTVESRATTAR